MLTSKERVLLALRHEEPDRVPTGEYEFEHAIVEPVMGRSTYRSRRATLQAYWEGRRDDVVDNWKTGLVKLTEHYRWDAVVVHAVPGRDTPIEVPEPMGVNQWRDSRGCRVQYSEDTDYFAVVEKPGRPAEAAAPPAGSPVLTDPTDDELEVVRHVVRELGRTHFIVGAALCPKPFPRPRFYGYADATRSEVEDWVDVYDDPDAIAESRLKAVTGPTVRRGIELAKREQIDAIAYGHDYGCSSGPFLSPELFRRAIFPALKVYADIVHSFGLLMVHHCCGYNLPLIDQMIEAGVDVYQSVQAEMDLAVLKKRYGANLAFWGGVPAGLLVTGTPDEVRAAGKKAIDIGKPGGGFIYSTSHSVMPGAKPENYRAMLDALAEHGAYR